MEINKPIFLIGTGRCGSTIIFEALCVHEDIGWLSNYNKLFPRLGFVSIMPRLYNLPFFGKVRRGEKKQYGQGSALLNRLLPTPFECYAKWKVLCGDKFLFSFLKDVEATPDEKKKVLKAVKQLLFWQGKKRFAAKYTGPARIGFVKSIFPDAVFVHIKRDARAVIYSLLNVDFWTEQAGKQRPRWAGGLSEDWHKEWESYDSSLLALAAMQYRTIMQICQKERQLLDEKQYLEIRFEDFVTQPQSIMEQILSFCELRPLQQVTEYIKHQTYIDTNKKYLQKMPKEQEQLIERIIGQWH
ncbi:sulfotransferase [Planctomycetota bacterium]